MKTAELGAPLAGDGIRGEPFEDRHRDALRAACAEDPDIWNIYVTNFGPADFDRNIDLLSTHRRNCTFVLFEGDDLVGMSSFLGIDEARQVAEIGSTYYRPAFRGTGFNARAKDMMLRRAFACGVRRVEFRVDSRNARSQAAMAKIGGVREGVLRADRITWTGHVRDTVLFSILAAEWPAR
jgi:RimJ/RimL family protein N-acetyltransferase